MRKQKEEALIEMMIDIKPILDEIDFESYKKPKPTSNLRIDLEPIVKNGWEYRLSTWRYNEKEDMEVRVIAKALHNQYYHQRTCWVYLKTRYKKQIGKNDKVIGQYYINYFIEQKFNYKCFICHKVYNDEKSIITHYRTQLHLKTKMGMLENLLQNNLNIDMINNIASFLH